MNRRAGVVGLGVSGRGAAKLLAENGYAVTAFDQKASDVPSSLRDYPVDLVREEDAEELAEHIVALRPDFLVVSPGIPPSSPLFEVPASRGIPVIGEVELAWRLRAKAEVPWLVVTGTNGKTTTVGMANSILEVARWGSRATGNIGYPLTAAVNENHDALVVELSSFQLATSFTVQPWASICLNVDSDHLDWHGTVEEYRDAKARVYNRAIRARLFFDDDPIVKKMAQKASSAENALLVPLCFGAVREGGVGVQHGVLVDRAFGVGDPVDGGCADLRKVDYLAAPLADDEGVSSPMVRDALAAAALALSLGVGGTEIVDGLNAFQAAPHRFSRIPTADGITWIDDSKATNVHAAAGALKNVEAGRAVWIVGGDTKGQDLGPLIEQAGTHVRAAVVIGADREPLLSLFKTLAPNVAVTEVAGVGDPADWMVDVVRACQEFARRGDSVLLAPACASWDQFSSYAQRGDFFRAAVEATVEQGR